MSIDGLSTCRYWLVLCLSCFSTSSMGRRVIPLKSTCAHELGQLGQATGGSTVTSAEVLNGYGSNIIVYCIYIYNI